MAGERVKVDKSRQAFDQVQKDENFAFRYYSTINLVICADAAGSMS